MSIFNALQTSASALTAQRLRMDVTSSNIANAQTTRATMNETGEYEPYRRKMVTLQPNHKSFKSILHKAKGVHSSIGTGVKIASIVEDEQPFKVLFNPTHPDADAEGYVQLPNIDPLKEMVDLMSATRSYEANITSLNASKNILMKTLEIGR